ncbi:MAG TPA: TIGR03086 family metal-binding protein [Acidimicrobiales bacterium]|nr:TIGR03086 family metal-binding protein [Acidimicrobiales bacterium]
MSRYSDIYATVAEGFTKTINSCTDEAWGSSSPCEGWTARDIAVHSAETHWRVASMVTGSEPLAVDPAGDVAAQWTEASRQINGSLADSSLATKMVPSRGGEMPWEQLVGTMLSADTLLHTWDIARAAGLDERLDPMAVESVYEFMKPNDKLLRVPGGFADKIEAPPGSDLQTQLLCFSGRMV